MTTAQDIYNCTPRQARAFIVDCIKARRVPFIKSSPGLGKSSLMRSVADEFNLWMIDHRLSTSAPEDLSGLPRFVDGKATFTPFDIFPVEGTPMPKGKDGWMIFLDEANSGTKMVQAASYKLVLDRMVGQARLHQNTCLTMAGNLSTDRAFVNPLSTAMQSRVVHIKLVPSLQEWMEDVAIPQNYDERIVAYLGYKGVETLMDFRPDHQEETFCCPRTWEFMNDLISGQTFAMHNGVYEMDAKIPLYAGTITSGVAVDFVQFTKVFHSIVKITDVVKDPTGTPVPTDSQSVWAITSHLSAQVDKDTFGPVSTYVNRLPMTFRVIFFRTMKARHPELRQHPAFKAAMIELAEYLYGA